MEIEQIQQLNRFFAPKLQKGNALPDAKSVRDGSSFYLLNSGVYYEHIMLNGIWYKKVADGNSNIILQEV